MVNWTPMLIEDDKGNQLLDLVRLEEEPDLSGMVFALTAVFYHNRPLFVFNNWRQYWEIPGGGIDAGETPLEAAHRELYEESGQRVQGLRLFAKLQCKFVNQSEATWGVLYVGQLDKLATFEPTEEIGEMIIWDGSTDIGTVSEIDRYLLELICG